MWLALVVLEAGETYPLGVLLEILLILLVWPSHIFPGIQRINIKSLENMKLKNKSKIKIVGEGEGEINLEI